MSLQRREKQQRERALRPSELKLFKTLAASIADDADFKRILETVALDRREIIYGQIKTALKFECLPFAELFPIPNIQ